MEGASVFRARFARQCLAITVILVLIGLTAARAGAEGLAPLRLEGGAASFPLDGHLEVLDDKGGLQTIDEIGRGGGFHVVARPGIATGTLWYRFTVVRAADGPADWVLAFGEPDIDDVRVYVPKPSGGFTESRLGRRIPSGQLPLAARLHMSTLSLPGSEPVTLYIRLSSQHKIRFEEAALWRPGALMFEQARQSVLHGIQFCLMAVIIVTYALFGLWLRDVPMLLYAAFVGTSLCRDINHSGVVALVFPNVGADVNYLLSGIGLLGGISAFVFMWDRMLDLRKSFPAMHRAYTLAGTLTLLSLFWVWNPNFSFIAIPAQIVMLAVSVSSTVIAIILVRRNKKDILLKFYLCAFLPFVLAWGVEISALLTFSIPIDLGRRMVIVATMGHMVILCGALAYRFGRMRREQMRAETALAGERLARQHQRNFIEMATHEFKTPLAVIDCAVQMLELLVPSQAPEVTGRFATIRRAVQRQVALIETCLVSDRNETLAIKLCPVAPAEIVMQAAERNEEPGRTILVTMHDLPEIFLADANLLGIALDALMDNARRYGPVTHPVEISAHAEGGKVQFAVEDRGGGIPSEETAFIFDKYYRGSSCGAVPGTGIGLHLVKTIAAMHGGEVSYRSRDGGGASFVLTVPIG